MPHKRAKRSVREQQRNERGADLAPPSGNNRTGTGISTERIPKSAARVLDAARIRAEYRQKRARQETDANDNYPGAAKLPPSKKRRRGAGAGADESKVLGKKGTDGPNGTTIQIQSGESLKHFNRRVEDHMRPLVQSAMRASAATERKGRKAAAGAAASSHASKPTAPNKTHRASSPSSLTSSATFKKSKAHADDAPPSSPATGLTTRGDDRDRDRPKEFATTSSAAPRRLNDIATAPPELKRLPRGAAKHPAGGDAKTAARAGAGAGVLSMAQRAMMEVEREKAIRRYREMKERKAKEADRTFSQGEGHVGGGG